MINRPEYMRNYRIKNADRLKVLYQKHYESHKDEYKLRSKKQRENNKEYLKKYWNEYRKQRKKIDPEYKIMLNLRRRLHKAFKNDFKKGSAIKDLGCSISELKQHLESKFQPGMTWENYGPNGWHIDHIIPFASFDLTNKEELIQVCHYTNLQPLWAKDNWSKSKKILDK